MREMFALIACLALAGCSSAPTAARPDPPPVDTAAVPTDTAGVWMTTGDETKLLSHEPRAVFLPGRSTAPYALVVDEGKSYQEMVGFGAAFTDASTWLIQTKMSPAQRERLLVDLFSPTRGIGLSFMRMTMGSSDFSRTHWSYDDVPVGQTDPELKRFSIERDREAMLPVIEQALAINPQMTLMASPWSAPGWMKTTGSLVKGRLRPEAYDAFARYFLEFLEAYRAEGVPVSYISVQNEPHFEPDNYPGMRMEPAERARFIGQYLGPLLERSGLQTKILDWDHNWDEPQSPLAVLADSAARRYVSGVAWHCYAGDVAAQGPVHAAYPDKDAFFTECSGGEWSPKFGDNLKFFVGKLIIGSTRHWSRGAALWNLALDPQHGPHNGGCGDCRGVVTIDPASGAVTRNVEYYALAHASRFVRPGALRIESTPAADGLENVAFRNPDGSRALIVLNGAGESRTFSVQAGGRSFDYTLPAGAVATFRWP